MCPDTPVLQDVHGNFQLRTSDLIELNKYKFKLIILMTNSVLKNKSSVSFMKHRPWVVSLRTQINISLQEAQRNLVQNGTVVARPHRPRARKSSEIYSDSCRTLILRCIYFYVLLHSYRYWYRLLHEIPDSHKTCTSCATHAAALQIWCAASSACSGPSSLSWGTQVPRSPVPRSESCSSRHVPDQNYRF